MKIKVLTLFPEMLEPMLNTSILGRAIKNGALEVELIDLRSYSKSKHMNTDDYPFGGGAGMVMLPQVVTDAIEANTEPGTHRVYLSPRGRTLTQRVVEEYAKLDSLLLLCGHYEGVDERAIEMCIDEELSIGDYVLTGGELGAMVTIDAVSRLLPGVLGCEESCEDESFTTGLLEYPQYTRPAEYKGRKVPEVLLGGNHKDILEWRRRMSLELTRKRRPDLLESAPLTDEDKAVLARSEAADRLVEELEKNGIRAERMEMFSEKAWPKEWFNRIVPEENRRAAKKACFSGRRHVGYLYRAFSEGYAVSETGDAAGKALEEFSGAAVLFCERYGIALEIDDAKRITDLKPLTILCSKEMSVSFAASNKGVLFMSK